MKASFLNRFAKPASVFILVLFAFVLQSFSGIRIEKRRYRPGYYVHICHKPKTKPVAYERPEVSTTATKQETKVEEEPVQNVSSVPAEKIISTPPSPGNPPPVSQGRSTINNDDSNAPVSVEAMPTRSVQQVNLPKIKKQ